MTEIQMTKTKKFLEAYQPYLAPFGALKHSGFGFIQQGTTPDRRSLVGSHQQS
jgi:hypothetical protein